MSINAIKSVKLKGEENTVDVSFTYTGPSHLRVQANETGHIQHIAGIDGVPAPEAQIEGESYVEVTADNAFAAAFLTGAYESTPVTHTYTFPDGTTFEDVVDITYNGQLITFDGTNFSVTPIQDPIPTKTEFFEMMQHMIDDEQDADYKATLTTLKATLEAIPDETWNWDMYPFPAKS